MIIFFTILGQCQNSDAIGDYEYYYYYEDELLPTTGIVIDRLINSSILNLKVKLITTN